MIARVPVYILRFFALVLLQVLIVKNIELGSYMNPFMYVLFILLLPVNTPGTVLLVVSFLTGMVVDMFYDTMGMHAAACVFTAFCRPGIIKFISPREGYEDGTEPSLQQFGLPWFFSYAGILVLIHHLFLFYIERFSFTGFFSTLLKSLASGLVSMVLMVLIQYIFYRDKNRI